MDSLLVCLKDRWRVILHQYWFGFSCFIGAIQINRKKEREREREKEVELHVVDIAVAVKGPRDVEYIEKMRGPNTEPCGMPCG